METIKNKTLTGERALFHSSNLQIEQCIFENGESPLKESNDLKINQSIFKWKYPLWYTNDVTVANSTLTETARSGIWYTHGIEIVNSTIEAPKTFRRSSNITLENVSLPLALETLWNCNVITMKNVTARGDYFAMNSNDINVGNLNLTGNYSFDGCTNVTIENSVLLSKDAFWNCENVTVKNCTIIGEYLGWNSKNMTFIDCAISSLQGLCYIENLKMVNCNLLDTTLAFEYSTVDVQVDGEIASVINPTSGVIKAKAINELIMDGTKIDPAKTQIIIDEFHQSDPRQAGIVCN